MVAKLTDKQWGQFLLVLEGSIIWHHSYISTVLTIQGQNAIKNAMINQVRAIDTGLLLPSKAKIELIKAVRQDFAQMKRSPIMRTGRKRAAIPLTEEQRKTLKVGNFGQDSKLKTIAKYVALGSGVVGATAIALNSNVAASVLSTLGPLLTNTWAKCALKTLMAKYPPNSKEGIGLRLIYYTMMITAVSGLATQYFNANNKTLELGALINEKGSSAFYKEVASKGTFQGLIEYIFGSSGKDVAKNLTEGVSTVVQKSIENTGFTPNEMVNLVHKTWPTIDGLETIQKTFAAVEQNMALDAMKLAWNNIQIFYKNAGVAVVADTVFFGATDIGFAVTNLIGKMFPKTNVQTFINKSIGSKLPPQQNPAKITAAVTKVKPEVKSKWTGAMMEIGSWGWSLTKGVAATAIVSQGVQIIQNVLAPRIFDILQDKKTKKKKPKLVKCGKYKTKDKKSHQLYHITGSKSKFYQYRKSNGKLCRRYVK